MGIGKIQSKLAYDYFRQRKAKLAWPKMVWQSFITPKHAFILWLGLKGKLLTKDKLQGVIEDTFAHYAGQNWKQLIISFSIAA